MASKAAKEYNKGYHGRYPRNGGGNKKQGNRSGPKQPASGKGWVKVIPLKGRPRMEQRRRSLTDG